MDFVRQDPVPAGMQAPPLAPVPPVGQSAFESLSFFAPAPGHETRTDHDGAGLSIEPEAYGCALQIPAGILADAPVAAIEGLEQRLLQRGLLQSPTTAAYLTSLPVGTVRPDVAALSRLEGRLSLFDATRRGARDLDAACFRSTLTSATMTNYPAWRQDRGTQAAGMGDLHDYLDRLVVPENRSDSRLPLPRAASGLNQYLHAIRPLPAVDRWRQDSPFPSVHGPLPPSVPVADIPPATRATLGAVLPPQVTEQIDRHLFRSALSTTTEVPEAALAPAVVDTLMDSPAGHPFSLRSLAEQGRPGRNTIVSVAYHNDRTLRGQRALQGVALLEDMVQALADGGEHGQALLASLDGGQNTQPPRTVTLSRTGLQRLVERGTVSPRTLAMMAGGVDQVRQALAGQTPFTLSVGTLTPFLAAQTPADREAVLDEIRLAHDLPTRSELRQQRADPTFLLRTSAATGAVFPTGTATPAANAGEEKTDGESNNGIASDKAPGPGQQERQHEYTQLAPGQEADLFAVEHQLAETLYGPTAPDQPGSTPFLFVRQLARAAEDRGMRVQDLWHEQRQQIEDDARLFDQQGLLTIDDQDQFVGTPVIDRYLDRMLRQLDDPRLTEQARSRLDGDLKLLTRQFGLEADPDTGLPSRRAADGSLLLNDSERYRFARAVLMIANGQADAMASPLRDSVFRLFGLPPLGAIEDADPATDAPSDDAQGWGGELWHEIKKGTSEGVDAAKSGAKNALSATGTWVKDAAAPALHWIEENETPLNRTLGVAQGVGGALEIVAGGATLFTTGLTGVGAVGGGLLIASGVDNFMTGVQTAWDGKTRHTMISDGIGSAAEWAGASPEMAEAIRSTSDIMTPGLATTLGRAGIRAGQQALEALALKPHDPFAPALAGGPQGATAASVFRQDSAADSAGSVLATAANAGEEAAEAAEGAAEKPKEHERAAAKNYRGIKVDKEGQPYCEGTSYTYKTWAGKEAVTAIVTKGNRIGDRLSANKALKISEEEFDFLRKEGYHLHHRNDFDEKTKECTVEYVQRDAHRATYPHQGAIKQYNDYIKRSKESE